MNSKVVSLEEIHSSLMRSRQDPATRRKFPKELWESIIRLTEIHSIEKICRYLKINPAYLRTKIRRQQEPTFPEFREISIKDSCTEVIVIELSSDSGLRARIQGPPSCLNCLKPLFRG